MPEPQTFSRPGFAATFGTVYASNIASSGPIASSVLATAAANITFSAIPSTYDVLWLLVVGASAAAAETDRWSVTVNGTGGSSYDLVQVGATVSGTPIEGARNAYSSWLTPTASPPGDMPGASATAGAAGILQITIPGYAGTTLQKVGLWRSGYSDAAAAAADQEATSGLVAFRSTAAISSIAIAAGSGSNLVVGTTALLYGC
jgi:hypothetical protein